MDGLCYNELPNSTTYEREGGRNEGRWDYHEAGSSSVRDGERAFRSRVRCNAPHGDQDLAQWVKGPDLRQSEEASTRVLHQGQDDGRDRGNLAADRRVPEHSPRSVHDGLTTCAGAPDQKRPRFQTGAFLIPLLHLPDFIIREDIDAVISPQSRAGHGLSRVDFQCF